MAGTELHFPTGPIRFGNATYDATSLNQELQILVEAITALVAAQIAVRVAMTAMQGAEAKVGPTASAYRRFIQATFAGAIHELADFGLQPVKVAAPLTSEKRVVAVAKARATREARGTTSKKQKLAIHGNVTGVTVIPVTTPPASPETAPAK